MADHDIRPSGSFNPPPIDMPDDFVPIEDAYEEVFRLYTEGDPFSWRHNRAVSQQIGSIEIELQGTHRTHVPSCTITLLFDHSSPRSQLSSHDHHAPPGPLPSLPSWYHWHCSLGLVCLSRPPLPLALPTQPSHHSRPRTWFRMWPHGARARPARRTCHMHRPARDAPTAAQKHEAQLIGERCRRRADRRASVGRAHRSRDFGR